MTRTNLTHKEDHISYPVDFRALCRTGLSALSLLFPLSVNVETREGGREGRRKGGKDEVGMGRKEVVSLSVV